MAVVNVKSTAVGNSDAVPRVPNSPWFQNGVLKEDFGSAETTAGDSIGSTFRLARISSSARVTNVLLQNDAQGAAVTADVGLYRTAADGGVVVDADFFASALALTAASAGYVDVTYESAVVDFPNHGKRLWEQLGLLADPMVDYDVVVTIGGAAVVTGGTLAMKMRHIDGA